MICVLPFIVASVSVTVAARRLEYDSIRTLQPHDLLGCRVTGTEVIYNCSDQEPSASDLPKAQVLRFRVDCREAQVKFQKLTIFDEAGICGAIDYTKYTGDTSDPTELLTISWTPFVPPRNYSAFTFKQGDLFDIQCVLMTLQEVNMIKDTTDSNSYRRWWFDFQFIRDGSQAKDQRGSFRVFEFQTPVLGGAREQRCESDLEDVYHWKVSSHSELKSSENPHWIDLASPQFLDDPSYFPSVDIPVVRSGELFRVSAQSLHLLVTSWEYPNIRTDIARLNPLPGDCEMEKQILFHKRFGIDESQLPVGTQKIKVDIHVSWRLNNPHSSEFFSFILPVFNAGVKPATTTTTTVTPEEPAKDDTTVKPEEPAKENTTVKPEEPAKEDTTGKPEEPAKDDSAVKPDKPADDSKSKSSGSWFFWPLTIVIVLALLAAIAYVYRERLGFTPRAVRTSTGAAIEMQAA